MLHAIDATGYSKAKEWCGPGALSALTGQPLKTSTEQLCRIHGGSYEDLSGVWEEDVILALHEHGKRATAVDVVSRYPELTHGPTLKRFLAERRPHEVASPMLIKVSGHFITAHWSYLCDNWTLKPTPMAQFPMTGRLVKAAWLIT